MRPYNRHAFTLFEILIVLAVIAVIGGTAFYGLARSNDDRALEKGADMLHDMVRVARTQAITNGVHARLIVNLDTTDEGNYLRQVGVMIEHADSNKWIAVDRGIKLPEGVFVVPQAGSVSFPVGWPATGRRSVYRLNNTAADASAVYTFDYPLKAEVNEVTASSPSWFCIQFAPNGRLSSGNWGGGGLVPVANQLVLARGSWRGNTVEFGSAVDFIGIAFKRNGASYQTRETELVDDNE